MSVPSFVLKTTFHMTDLTITLPTRAWGRGLACGNAPSLDLGVSPGECAGVSPMGHTRVHKYTKNTLIQDASSRRYRQTATLPDTPAELCAAAERRTAPSSAVATTATTLPLLWRCADTPLSTTTASYWQTPSTRRAISSGGLSAAAIVCRGL